MESAARTANGLLVSLSAGDFEAIRPHLRTVDLGSDKLILTQESMAQMIGARRNSVSLVANALQQAKFIHYSRGHIEITNLDGLGKTSCECYATVKAHYERLLRPRALS